MYRRFFKRLIDIVLSLCAMLVLAVPMLIFASFSPGRSF